MACGNAASRDANNMATPAAFAAAGLEFGPEGALAGFAIGLGVDVLSGYFTDDNLVTGSALEGLGATTANGGNPAAFIGTQAGNLFRGAFQNRPGIGIVGGAIFGSVVQNAVIRGSIGVASAVKFGALSGAAYLLTYAPVWNSSFDNCMRQ